MRTKTPDRATEVFVAHRNLLFTVAYEMLGSAADAEDVLQETWLRWAQVDLHTVREQRAYLVRIATRQALARLRVLGRRKESYVGPWLPEPLLTSPDVAEDVEPADSVSMAKSRGAVRQISHRARAHVAARRPRGATSPSETRAALQAFERAVQTGDLQSLLDVLAPEVVALSDGGGIRRAPLHPLVGADKVARLLSAHFNAFGGRESVELAQINCCPALIMRLDGEVENVVAVRIDDGLVTGLYVVRNPEKLSRVERETAVSRSHRGAGLRVRTTTMTWDQAL
jgi:hypothetical protein